MLSSLRSGGDKEKKMYILFLESRVIFLKTGNKKKKNNVVDALGQSGRRTDSC